MRDARRPRGQINGLQDELDACALKPDGLSPGQLATLERRLWHGAARHAVRSEAYPRLVERALKATWTSGAAGLEFTNGDSGGEAQKCRLGSLVSFAQPTDQVGARQPG
jgi:hypothetical protein